MTIEQDMQAIHCYHIRMSVKVPVPQSIARTGGAAFSWLLGGWRIMLFGVIVLSLTFSPTTYKREHRYAIANQHAYHHIQRVLGQAITQRGYHDDTDQDDADQ